MIWKGWFLVEFYNLGSTSTEECLPLPYKYHDLNHSGNFLQEDSDSVVGTVPTEYLPLLNGGKYYALQFSFGFVPFAPKYLSSSST